MMNDKLFGKTLAAHAVAEIPGMFVFDLPVHGDNRGWFKENFQAEKFAKLGQIPEFFLNGKLQNNISFNTKVGTTRGLHAEPWNKFISTANGRVFGAWCDLRKGKNFGHVFSIEINPSVGVFVPKGVANGFQTLDENVTYTYLVDDYWSPDAKYAFVSLFDKSLGIQWPIDLSEAEVSVKDRNHPNLAQVKPLIKEDLQ